MSPKSVVVTGDGSGIGLAVTLELAHAGFDVIGSVRSEEKADALRKEVERTGAAVRTVLLDVTDPTSTVKALTEIATMTDGGPWAVVNNALAQPGAMEDVDDEQVRRQLETNLIARPVSPGWCCPPCASAARAGSSTSRRSPAGSRCRCWAGTAPASRAWRR